MARVLVLLAIVSAAILAVTIVDLATIPRERIKHMPRALWILVAIFGLVFGSILWFTLGRARKGEVVPGVRRPVGPDDDPEFLGQVRLRTLSKEQEERIRELERRLAELDEVPEPERPSRADTGGAEPEAGPDAEEGDADGSGPTADDPKPRP